MVYTLSGIEFILPVLCYFFFREETETQTVSLSYPVEEVNAAEKFMRTVPLDDENKPNNNRKEMLEKLRLTRDSRRKFVSSEATRVPATTFLNKYPRLRDMKEAVS